jgi:hypothetical protein
LNFFNLNIKKNNQNQKKKKQQIKRNKKGKRKMKGKNEKRNINRNKWQTGPTMPAHTTRRGCAARDSGRPGRCIGIAVLMAGAGVQLARLYGLDAFTAHGLPSRIFLVVLSFHLIRLVIRGPRRSRV